MRGEVLRSLRFETMRFVRPARFLKTLKPQPSKLRCNFKDFQLNHAVGNLRFSHVAHLLTEK